MTHSGQRYVCKCNKIFIYSHCCQSTTNVAGIFFLSFLSISTSWHLLQSVFIHNVISTIYNVISTIYCPDWCDTWLIGVSRWVVCNNSIAALQHTAYIYTSPPSPAPCRMGTMNIVNTPDCPECPACIHVCNHPPMNDLICTCPGHRDWCRHVGGRSGEYP